MDATYDFLKIWGLLVWQMVVELTLIKQQFSLYIYARWVIKFNVGNGPEHITVSEMNTTVSFRGYSGWYSYIIHHYKRLYPPPHATLISKYTWILVWWVLPHPYTNTWWTLLPTKHTTLDETFHPISTPFQIHTIYDTYSCQTWVSRRIVIGPMMNVINYVLSNLSSCLSFQCILF